MKAEWMKKIGPPVAWCLAGVAFVLIGFTIWSYTDDSGSEGLYGDDSNNFDGCNVVGINVHGCIMTYAPAADEGTSGVPEGCDAMTISENVLSTLQSVKGHRNIRAVLLDIDSTGGQAQAAVEIEDAIKSAGLPTTAWIRAYGDSAAYWIASAADTIIASEESDIGSIGVTSSYTDNAKQNTEEGLTYNSLSTGKYKDLGNPNKSLTAEERALVERGNKITLEHFIKTIATNRNLAIEKVQALADGSSWLGEEALSLGLIDKLGTYPVVLAHLKEVLKEEPVICWQN